MSKIEILHSRDPDSDCTLVVYLDGTEVTDFAEIDIDPGGGHERADWEESKAYDLANLSPAVREIVREQYAWADSSQYIDNTGWIKLSLKIENIYEDGDRIKTFPEVWAPEPPETEGDQNLDEFDEWADEYILPATGTGKTEGNSAYFVEILKIKSDDGRGDSHPLIGHEFEFGV